MRSRFALVLDSTRAEDERTGAILLPSVGPRRPSDFPTYDLITITLSGKGHEQKVDFLLSQDGKTLAKVTKIDLTKDIYAERMNKIDVSGRPARGNPDAKVTIVKDDATLARDGNLTSPLGAHKGLPARPPQRERSQARAR